jgi:hypothetical protein
MTQEQIAERNKQIALMLGLKPLNKPYLGAYQPTRDTHNSAFYHERIEGESWYIYPKYDVDWNYLMEAIQFLQKHFESKERSWTTIERYPLYTDIKTVFVIVSDFAKHYNEGKL